MYIHLNLSSGAPIYGQIVDQIKYMVVSRALVGDDKLPSIRQLASDLSINPTTVVKAYDELEHAGIIYRRRGQGCFINTQVPSITRKERSRLVGEHTRSLAVEGLRLGLSSQEILSALEEELNNIEEKRK
ncbi:GntR family transcriptional regulator [Candidatus Hydrogenedentota bacterium]